MDFYIAAQDPCILCSSPLLRESVGPLSCSSCSKSVHLSCWTLLQLEGLATLPGRVSWTCPECLIRTRRFVTAGRGTGRGYICNGCRKVFPSQHGLIVHRRKTSDNVCFLAPPPPPPPGVNSYKELEEHYGMVRSKVSTVSANCS